MKRMARPRWHQVTLPVVQQAAYGGTVGVAKNLLELGAAAELKATAPFVEGRSITDPVDPMESRGMGAGPSC